MSDRYRYFLYVEACREAHRTPWTASQWFTHGKPAQHTELRRAKYIPDPDEMGDDPDWSTYV